MTETVEQTRRSLFEAKFIAPYYVRWNTDKLGYYTIHRDSSRKHGAERYNANWEGFNAALDSVEIELPRIGDQPVEDHYCWSACEDKCRSSIQSLNLGLRIK